ncbi:hypothetical protein HPB47_028213, partial [Ixodes persulcatus]
MWSSLHGIVFLLVVLKEQEFTDSLKSEYTGSVLKTLEDIPYEFFVSFESGKEFMDVFVPTNCLKDNTALFKAFLKSREKPQSTQLHTSLLSSSPSRVLYAVMALTFVVMSTAFKGRLTSLLNDLPLNGEATQFVSVAHLLGRGYRLCVLENPGIFDTRQPLTIFEKNGSLEIQIKSCKTSNSARHSSRWIVISADGRDTFFTYNSQTGPSEALRRELLGRGYVETEDLLWSYPVGPEMRPSSVYRQDFGATLSWAIEAGIYERYAALAKHKSRFFRENSLEHAKELVLNFGDLRQFFLAWFVDFSPDGVVYPTLLEARDDRGQYTISLDDGTSVKLSSSSAIDDALTLHTYEEGKLVVQKVDMSKIRNNLYENEETMTSLLMSKTRNGVELEGVLNDTHRIEPYHAMERSDQGQVAHKIYKIPTMTPIKDDAVLSSPGFEETSKAVEERTLPAIVYPEIFVISDSKHNEVFESTEDFVKYVVVFFSSVALRYAKVQHPRIFPKLVGVERASRQSEPYIRMYSSDQMTAEHTLDELARHVAERQTEFRGVDLVLLLTGRSMVSVSTGTARPGVAGLAFTGGMCTKRRVAESIDRRGFYEGIRHAAHEMGHSFGAAHDGHAPVSHIPGNQGAYHCSWDDGYEMSYVAKNLNQFTFSRCSQEQFRVFFSLVPQRCLDRTYTQKKPTPSKKLPGDRLSRRRFCMRLTSNNGAKECT